MGPRSSTSAGGRGEAHGQFLEPVDEVGAQPAGLAGLVVKLQGCELNHQLAALAIDALGELGVLYHDGPHLRAKGSWQRSYMFDLGLIIGGGILTVGLAVIAFGGRMFRRLASDVSR